MMPGQGPNAYLCERRGNFQHLVDVFSAQRKYLDGYLAAISAFSSDDQFESMHWVTHAAWAGQETAHMFPFKAKLLYACKLAGLTDVHEVATRFAQWPLIQAFNADQLTSKDGLVSVRCFRFG